MRHQLALVVTLSALASGLVPSTNIFTPPWLAQRRSRHFGGQYLFPQTQPLYHTYPSTTYPRAAPYGHGRQAYYVQQAYSPVLTPFELTPRTYYPAPVFTHYLAPVSGNNFAKRVDSVKPAEENLVEQRPKTPCPLLQQVHQPSDHYPVYVLPPKNFQPIIYHQQSPLSPHSYVSSVPVVYQPSTVNHVKSAEEIWYETGGEGKMKVPTNAHNDIEPEQSRDQKKILLVPVTDHGAIGQFPVFEAVIREVQPSTSGSNNIRNKIEAINPYNNAPQSADNKDTRRLKTKLPVGLTSFFLGGVRGVSGRHWAMPPEIVKNLEFMPNSSPMSPENKYLPEESYVKQVDTDQSASAIADEPEKEEADSNSKSSGNKKMFENNTVVDSPLDLEAQESSSVPQQQAGEQAKKA